jgi:uncharacterized protein (TIGR00156 family)
MLVFGTLAVNAEGFTGPDGSTGGGSAGSNLTPTTISEAQNLPDRSAVVLRGKIIGRIPKKSDEYIFADSTGQVTVDIDDWNGWTITENDTVEIYGNIVKRAGRINKIGVKFIRKI